MVALSIHDVYSAAKYLWVLGKNYGKDKQVVDAPTLLKRLQFSASTYSALVRHGFVVETKEKGVVNLPERVFSSRRILPRGKEYDNIRATALSYLSQDPHDNIDFDRNKVALLIDWDNFVGQLARYDLGYSSRMVMKKIRALGDVAISMVFTDISRLDYQARADLYAAGYELIDCPKLGIDSHSAKDTADSALISRILWLIQYCPTINTVAIATEDRDFIKAVSLLRSHNKKVVIINASLHDGSLLHRQADQVVTLFRSSGQEVKLITNDFVAGVYEQKDPELQEFMQLMKLVVQAMDQGLPTDGDSLSYSGLKNYLLSRQDLPEDRLPPASLDSILQFFIQRNVVIRLQGRDGQSARYKLNRNHTFVTWSVR